MKKLLSRNCKVAVIDGDMQCTSHIGCPKTTDMKNVFNENCFLKSRDIVIAVGDNVAFSMTTHKTDIQIRDLLQEFIYREEKQ